MAQQEQGSSAQTAALARAFKALSNPNRLLIYQAFLAYWRQGDEAAGRDLPEGCLLSEGVKRLNIGAPTVSHHVKELQDAGLITTDRRGRQLYCSINPVMLERLIAFLGETETLE